jgi:transposase
MLSFTGSLKVFVAVEPCDLRRGHNGLLALVGEKLREDIKSGALFVFTNKRRRLLKILYWDGTGLWLASKRLEQGTFSWPRSAESGALKLKLAPEALAMLTDGIDLRDGAQRPWYERA